MEQQLSQDGRRARGDRTRRQVLDGAVRIASTEGLEHLTIGRVATAAGVPKSTVQVLFKERERLQLHVLEDGAQRFADAVRERLDVASGENRLGALVEAWFDTTDSGLLPGGCLVTSAAAELRARSGSLRDATMAHRARWRAALLNAAEAEAGAGRLKPGTDVEQLVFEILALQSLASAGMGGPDRADFDRARTTARRLVASASAA